MTEIEKKIEELKIKLNNYSYSYYVLDAPIITDFEYDTLFNELKKLETSYPQFITKDSPTQRVGGEVSEKFEPYTHTVRMYSLDNSNSYEELKDWYERIKKITETTREIELVAELKIDGLAISLVYEDNFLKVGSTRGDGVVGENLTTNLKTIKSIPLKLFSNNLNIKNIEVRGEIFMPKTSFEKLNNLQRIANQKEFANPRNAAAGTLRQLDSKIVSQRDLSSFIYASLLPDNTLIKTHYESLMFLKELGFKTNPLTKLCKNIDEVIDFCEEWAEKRFNLNYATDGVVVKVNNLDLQKILGFTSRAPKWATAFKFPPEEVATYLKKIEIGVGKTGAITPVAVLEPVNLAGSVVQRASLYNFDEIKRLDVRVGDKVIIKKAAEIIPKVVSVDKNARTNDLKKFEIPKICPSCGADLITKENEVNLYCPNEFACPDQLKAKLEYWVSKDGMDIDGIGISLIEQLLDKKMIASISDLYKLEKDDLLKLDLIAEKSATNILKSIEKSKKQSLKNFINALGIRYVGKETADILASNFVDIVSLKKTTFDELAAISGIGEKIAQSIIDFFKETYNINLLNELFELGITPIANENTFLSNKLVGKTFVLTGALSFNRSEAEKLIKNHGGKVSSSVSKKTSYVVAGENAGSKFEKAKNFGIIILNEKEFLDLLESLEDEG